MNGIDDIENVTAQELARCLGVSDKRVYQLVEEGILERNKKKKFDLAQCVIKYIDFCKSGGGERARLYKYQADAKEIEVLQKRKELMPVAVHEQIIQELFSMAANEMDGAAGRFANKVPGISNAGAARKELLNENRIARAEWAKQIRRKQLQAGLECDSEVLSNPGSTPGQKPNTVGKRKPSTTKRKR